MLKLVLSDYRMDFREALKREKWSGGSVGFWMVYGVCSPKNFWGVDLAKLWRPYLIWYVIFIILGMAAMELGGLYSNELGKMFQLLPVSYQEKRRYLITGYLFRVLFPSALLAGHLCLSVVLLGFDIAKVCCVFFNLFFLMCIYNTYSFEERRMRKWGGERWLLGMYWVGMIFGYFFSWTLAEWWDLRQYIDGYNTRIVAGVGLVLMIAQAVLTVLEVIGFWKLQCQRLEQRP